jgi:CBS domain-containing protein
MVATRNQNSDELARSSWPKWRFKTARLIARFEFRFSPRQPKGIPLMTPAGTINEILHNKGTTVWSVPPDTMVYDAIQLMADKNIGALLVTEHGKLVGILSERDYTRKIALKGKSSKQTRVKEILSPEVIRVSPAQTVEDCMRLMTEHRIRHLPVLDGEKILGVISIGDLVNWIISTQTTTIHQLQTYISGYPG